MKFKNTVKDVLKAKIGNNPTIPNETIPQLVKESYQRFAKYRNEVAEGGDWEIRQGRLETHFSDESLNRIFEINADGSLEDVTQELRQIWEANGQAKEDALKS